MTTIKPFGSGDPLMESAFRDFVFFAWDQPEIRAEFEKETSMSLPPPNQSPIDSMIDEATGARGAVMVAFIEWIIREHWGPLDESLRRGGGE